MYNQLLRSECLLPDLSKNVEQTLKEISPYRKISRAQLALNRERDAYLESLLETLMNMMKTSFLCDTQLVLPDGTFKTVHWTVLSIIKPYLENLFNITTMGNYSWLLSVVDMTPSALDILVQLVYTGRTEITMNNVEDILVVASFLQMSQVVQQCEYFLVRQLTVSNCIELAMYSRNRCFQYVQLESFKFVVRNFIAVYQNNPDYLTRLELEDLRALLEHDMLNVPREEELFHAILKWTDHDPTNRKFAFPNLLSKIRMGLVKPSFLASVILQHPYVKNMSRDGLNVAFRYEEVKSKPRIPRTIIVALLGWSGGCTTPMMEAYDPRAEKWFFIHQRSTYLVSRAYHGAVALGRLIYVVGGFDGRLCYNTVVLFDTATYEWSERNPMQEFRCYVTVVAKDGILYAMGGFNGDKRCRSCERYDPNTNEWTFFDSMNERRSDAAGALHRGKIFMCGGFNGVNVLNSAEMYDSEVDQWTLIDSMISPRSGHGLASFNGHLYVIAGFNGISRLQAVERYDEVQTKWVPSYPILHPRSNFAAVVLEGRLYVIGGFNGTTTFNSVEVLNTDQHGWKNAASLCVHRSALAVCVLEDLENANVYHANASTLIVTLTENANRLVHVSGSS